MIDLILPVGCLFNLPIYPPHHLDYFYLFGGLQIEKKKHQPILGVCCLKVFFFDEEKACVKHSHQTNLKSSKIMLMKGSEKSSHFNRRMSKSSAGYFQSEMMATFCWSKVILSWCCCVVLRSWIIVKDITHLPTWYYSRHSNNEDRLVLFTYWHWQE